MSFDIKRFAKLAVISLLGVIITVISFAGGMVFHAQYYPSPQVSTVDTVVSTETITATATLTATAKTVQDDIPPEIATFWEAWNFLDENFYGEIPPDDKRIYGAVRGMVASFGDQHTAFIDPVRSAVSSENISGNFEGIGATIRLDEAGRLMIVAPFPDSPAIKAGLHPDDIILEVDGQSLDGFNLYESVLLIRGPANSKVVLTVFRKGQLKPFDVPVIRARIEIEVVRAELLEGNIGHIRIAQFSNGVSAKLVVAIEKLYAQGAESLIIDLRSNPGGLLSEAIDVSALFIKDGPVVIERLKGGGERKFNPIRSYKLALDVPMVVLVNGGSASASEIVAGAIQDKKRAVIIGEQSFGKGSVQLPHKLSDGSELRVTVAEWLTPNGRQIHKKGISPDVVVEMTFEDIKQELDPQLDEAVKFLREASIK